MNPVTRVLPVPPTLILLPIIQLPPATSSVQFSIQGTGVGTVELRVRYETYRP
jgi:hypothetical protein